MLPTGLPPCQLFGGSPEENSGQIKTAITHYSSSGLAHRIAGNVSLPQRKCFLHKGCILNCPRRRELPHAPCNTGQQDLKPRGEWSLLKSASPHPKCCTKTCIAQAAADFVEETTNQAKGPKSQVIK